MAEKIIKLIRADSFNSFNSCAIIVAFIGHELNKFTQIF